MYKDFYNLKSLPFRLSPDPSFFFGSKGHNRALAYLRYGLNQREGFIVITGKPGTGKTTLARSLLDEAKQDKVIVAEINTTNLDADNVMRMVAAQFGLDYENPPKASLLKNLESFFLARYRAGYHSLLVIDEAQNLPAHSLEELRMLSNFYSGNHALLQIFLLGQEQFRDILHSDPMEQLRQRVVAACHLEPLSETETQQYIEHRLQVVGWQGRPYITDAAFSLIHSFTAGIPRRINTFCDRLLLYGSLEQLYELDVQAVQSVAKELMLEAHVRMSPDEVEDNVEAQGEYVQGQLESPSEIDEPSEIDPPSNKVSRLSRKATPPQKSKTEEKESSRPTNSDNSHLHLVRPTQSNTAEDVAPQTQSEIVAEKQATVVNLDQALLDLVAKAYNTAKNPSQLNELSGEESEIPEKVRDLFVVALGYAKLPKAFLDEKLGKASLAEVKQALREYIRHLLLMGKPDYYRRLGVPYQASQKDIKRNYRYLFRLFQPDQEPDPKLWNETYTRRINQAYATLGDRLKRQKYDEFLLSLGKSGFSQEAPPAEKEPTPPVERFVAEPAIETELEEEPETRPLSAEDSSTKGFLWLIFLISILLLLIAGATVLFVKPDIFKQLSQTVSHEFSLDAAGLNARPTEDEFNRELPVKEPLTVPAGPTEAEITVSAEAIAPFPTDKETLGLARAKVDSIDQQPVVVKKKSTEPKSDRVKRVAASDKRPVTTKNTQLARNKKTVDKPPAPTKPKPLATISDRELTRFMNRFTAAYELGDLKLFMNLFSEKAITNDKAGVAEIAKDYETLFAATIYRSFELNNLNWKRNAAGAAGKGDFSVTVIRNDEGDAETFTGVLDINVEKVDDQLKMLNFKHSYASN